MQLRAFQRLARPSKVSAGILPVGIEEQLVKPLRQIVMMSSVCAGTAHRVVLLQWTEHTMQPARHRKRQQRARPDITCSKFHKVADGALLNRDRAIHIRFAKAEL